MTDFINTRGVIIKEAKMTFKLNTMSILGIFPNFNSLILIRPNRTGLAETILTGSRAFSNSPR